MRSSDLRVLLLGLLATAALSSCESAAPGTGPHTGTSAIKAKAAAAAGGNASTPADRTADGGTGVKPDASARPGDAQAARPSGRDPLVGAKDYGINPASPLRAALRKDYEKCSREKNGAACYEVATSYFGGLGIEVDFAKGNLFLIESCDKDHLMACSELAKNLANGMGLRQDVPTARSLLRSACHKGDAQACGNLAILYGAASSGYGNMFENFVLGFDKKAYFKKDPVKAAYYLGREATLVAETVARDPEYCQSSDPNMRSICVKNALRRLFGYGAIKDEAMARESLGKLCNEGDGEACHYYANNFSDKQSFISTLRRSCELGYVRSCSDMVLYITRRTGDMGAAEKACEDGTAIWCQYAAHERWDRITDVVRKEKEGASIGDAGGQDIKASIAGALKDRDAAIKLYERGCDLNDSYSCSALANIFGKGVYVKKNPELARAYKEKTEKLYPAVNPYANMNKFVE